MGSRLGSVCVADFVEELMDQNKESGYTLLLMENETKALTECSIRPKSDRTKQGCQLLFPRHSIQTSVI